MKTFKQFNEARMSAAVKLQRAFEREQQKSEASRRRGEEVMAQAKKDTEKKQQANEETVNEDTTQPNGTDKIEVGSADVATKKKTDKEMEDQQNESWTFDTAAMAKQELADAKNRKTRKRGKVANLLRKLGMKEEVEQIDEVNHREYASAGKMHPTMAKHMAVGQETDFYHSSTGDKVSGVVKHKSDKEVHIKAHKDGKVAAGDVHKFSISEDHLLEYEISHDGKGNYRDDEGNEWSGKDKNRPRGSFANRHTVTSKEPEHPHAVHINGKKWKSFGSQSHATNVAKKIKGATVHKEELNQEGILDKVKAVGKKALDTLGHGSDEDMRKDLQKKIGVPQTGKKPKSLREFIETIKEGKPAATKEVNVDKIHAAGDTPHEEKWEAAKKVKKESYTADQLLQALKEGMWPGTPEYTAKFGNQAKQGGGAGVKKGSRYGGSLQKPEKEDDNDADEKPAKKPKNK